MSELQMNRISSKHKVQFDNLGEILKPEILHEAVPELAEIDEARARYRSMLNEIQGLGKLTRSTGFVKDMHMQYVAQIDLAIWATVLDMFAKHDPETGDLMDDGLLYVTNDRGNIVLNRPFFYALLKGPLAKYDMRGKIKLT
jgi:hypothetical protein